jgi:hypothetical protein
MVEWCPRRARRRGSGRGGPTGAQRPGRPGTPPRAARGGCGGAWQRQVWAYCARNSRVRAYAAVFRAVSAHAPDWPQKTHNFPAHPTSPVSGRSAHGGRSYVFCSALAATGLASWYWANTNFGAAPCVFGGCRLSPARKGCKYSSDHNAIGVGRIGHKFKKICRRELQKVPKKGVSPTKSFLISVRFLGPSV